jgi:hypothetical protein
VLPGMRRAKKRGSVCDQAKQHDAPQIRAAVRSVVAAAEERAFGCARKGTPTAASPGAGGPRPQGKPPIPAGGVVEERSPSAVGKANCGSLR